jgi:hypothetical protein
MKNNFLLKDLILESRLDDVIKKYPEVRKDTIEGLSRLDPSGNNKYLDWMVYGSRLGVSQDRIVKAINSFHKNVNKLTKEFLDELIEEKKWGWLLTDNSPAAKIFQNIYKNPKDINNYKDYGIALEVFKLVDEKLSKSGVKKLEANVLYNDSNLLILIPKSHRASCYYGSGTKWCTTSKESSDYYDNYTKRGTLFYIINKKEPQTNPWYKTAIFVDNNGDVKAYDAPDTPTDLIDAKNNILNWEKVKDVIVDYLWSKGDKKGVGNFYFGDEYLSWSNSMGEDPLSILTYYEFKKILGGEKKLYDYLTKRGINPINYIPKESLLLFYIKVKESPEEVVKTVWNEAKNEGKNPISYFTSDHKQLLGMVVNGTINVDDFLNEIITHKYDLTELFKQTPTTDVVSFINYVFGDGNPKNTFTSFYNFLDSLEINLFRNVRTTIVKLLISEFSIEDKVSLLVSNMKSLKASTIEYGVSTEQMLAYCSNEEIKELLDRDLLMGVDLDTFLGVIENPEEAYWRYVASLGGVPFRTLGSWLRDYDFVGDYVLSSGVSKVFKTVKSFQESINKITGLDEYEEPILNVVDTFTTARLVKYFYNNNSYVAYLSYKEDDRLDEFSPVQIVLAYNDAPPDDKELKEKVFDVIEDALGGYNNGQIREENGEFYLTVYSMCEFEDLTANEETKDVFCNNDEEIVWQKYDSDIALEYTLRVDGVSDMIKDYLFIHVRGKDITLPDTYVDDFKHWVGDYNVGDGFKLTLYDEIIMSLSNENLIDIISNSSELSDFKKLITESYNKAANKYISNILDKKAMDTLENILGNRGQYNKMLMKRSLGGKSKLVDTYVYTFKLTHIVDDVIDYTVSLLQPANENSLPSYYLDMIRVMMDESIGRFDGKIELPVEEIVWGEDPEGDNFDKLLIYEIEDRLDIEQ